MSVQAPGRCSQKGTKVSANVLRRMPKQDSHPASKAQGWLASGCHLKLSLPTESQHAYHGKVSLEISHPTYAQSWVTFRHIPLGFEYFQGCRLYEQSGQPVPMFNNPHSKKKKKVFSLHLTGSSCISAGACGFFSHMKFFQVFVFRLAECDEVANLFCQGVELPLKGSTTKMGCQLLLPVLYCILPL